MTTSYKITILKSNATLKLSYRGGKFYRLEKLTGKLTDTQLQQIGRIIPPLENRLNDFETAFKDKVIYAPIEKTKTLYTQFADEWFSFYDKIFGAKPRFNASEGNHLKQIIKYLTDVTQDEKEALELWGVVLQSWDKLDDFYKNNADLKFINSQLNKILQNVKRINQTGTKTVSSDYLERIKRDLQSG